jgi:ATP-dependent Clp protease protease subunit
MKNDFEKYATKHKGISGMNLHRFNKATIENNYISPMIIEERQLNIASMDVFSRLQMDRIIFMGLPIDDYVANIIQAQLLYLDSVDSNRDISIYINSGGGSVTSGLGIYDVMNYISCDISTINIGMAASMAAVLLCSGTKGKRSSLKHSRTMIHQVSSGVEGTYSDMEITLNEVKKLRYELYQIISDNTGKIFEEVEKDCDRDHWLTSIEAKEYGLIDEVLYKSKK